MVLIGVLEPTVLNRHSHSFKYSSKWAFFCMLDQKEEERKPEPDERPWNLANFHGRSSSLSFVSIMLNLDDFRMRSHHLYRSSQSCSIL